MTPKLTDQQVEDLLRALEVQPRRFAKVLQAAIARNARGGSTKPDGWPRGKGYDGAGGPPRVTVEADEHGPEESVEVTAVELTIIARERGQRDELDDAVRAAIGHLVTAARNITLLRAQVERLENLRFDPEAANKLRCAAMARVNVSEPFYKRHEINGTTWNLGRWAYAFTIETGRLPNLDECRTHAQGRNVRRPAQEVAIAEALDRALDHRYEDGQITATATDDTGEAIAVATIHDGKITVTAAQLDAETDPAGSPGAMPQTDR